jgi:hypothetical protein
LHIDANSVCINVALISQRFKLTTYDYNRAEQKYKKSVMVNY